MTPKEGKMPTLQDVVDAVAAENTVIGSAVTLLDQLHQMLSDALASNDPAKVQAALDTIAAGKQQLSEAITRNTPAA